MTNANRYKDSEPTKTSPSWQTKALAQIAFEHDLIPPEQTAVDTQVLLRSPDTRPEELAQLHEMTPHRLEQALALRAIHLDEDVRRPATRKSILPRKYRKQVARPPVDTPDKPRGRDLRDDIISSIDPHLTYEDDPSVGNVWATLDERLLQPKTPSRPKGGFENRADSVGQYLSDISRFPLLNAEGEVELSKRIEAGLYADYKLQELEIRGIKDPNDDKEDLFALRWEGAAAKQMLLEGNLRLVVSIAKRYKSGSMGMMDFIGEGNGGLVRAVEKFDYKKGFKFSTYATWWIRQAITRGRAEQEKLIRLPVHRVDELRKLKNAKEDLRWQLGREATPEEVAIEMGLPLEQIHMLDEYNRIEPASLDLPVSEDGDATLGDLVHYSGQRPIEDMVAARNLQDDILAVIGNVKDLTSREYKILQHRFGLSGNKPLTLDQTGAIIGVTRERIRQIEAAALEKLRHPAVINELREFRDNQVIDD